MPLFLSHEAFGQKGERHSLAGQLEAGLRKVLGQGATFVMPSEEGADPGDADFFRRLSFQTAQARVIIRKPFSTKRIDGWNYMRNLMRWKQHQVRRREEFDPAYAAMLRDTAGIGRMMEYIREFEQRTTEVLPKMQVVSNCKNVIGAIQSLAYDENGKNPEDVKKTDTKADDVGDATRYLCVGYRRISDRLRPHGEAREERIADLLRSGLPVWGMGEESDDELFGDGTESGFFIGGGGSSRNSGVVVM